ncbi:unnamed protein product [Rotaria sp. Silwood1]|nr:unnamed protein product [Rotaria sp. Silwood1]CAF1080038.1 unnamed protein product [Rotaria sp. Silwood1]CAF3410514.1 unnamed protein product [Rotaria sp. Silwood1]CAF3439746.1 unnamed protein product [Rotaria sp. Silwood1]CAF3440170.1 unnamed protein product [Rotaria sp. Silwood1]
MEEQHSMINNNNNNSNEIVQITSLSNSRHLQIRRGILRQTTNLRSSPYNATLSNLRRRQTSLIASQTINNLISNIDNNDITNNNIQTNVNISSIEQDDIEMFIPENEIVQNNFLVTSDDENDNENFEVLVDFSNTSPIDLTITNENHNSNNEQSQSYHSLSTIDFDPDDDDNDDDHRFYYTSTSIPVLDYSSSSSSSTTTTTEPLIIHNNQIDMTQHQYYDEYSPSINHNSNNNEDLSIEIILETAQNNTLTRTPRRRRSIISSNIRNNRGLRLSDILSIPQKIYSSLKERFDDKYQQTIMINTQCYICLEDFQSIDSIKILNCQHIFHSECINEWLRSHSNCAYCRTTVLIDMLRSSSITTTRRRQRTRVRRNHNTITESPTNNSLQSISIESSTFEQQQS